MSPNAIASTHPLASAVLLTAGDVTHILQVDNRTLRRWVAAGKFPRPLHLEGVRRWRADDVRRFLDEAR